MKALYGPDAIRFMCDASEQSAYHRELALKISAHLSPDNRVCDAGCGLGYLSLALSPYCREVSAVDISSAALNVLRRNIRRTGCRNVRVTEGDIAACPPARPYDAMVFCFFCGVKESLKIAKTQCRGKVIIIKKDWEQHRFSLTPRPVPGFTLEKACGCLDRLGVRYAKETFALELGQPFRSLADAAAFFRIYSSDEEPDRITEKDVASRLLRRPSEEFPYYLPSLKRMGMIVIDAGDIPDMD